MHTSDDIEHVKEVSNDYLCPITAEVLLLPHKTQCCRNHLSEYAVVEIQRMKKPCPLCKEVNWSTTRDEQFMNEVYKLQVYCSYKKKGCKWKGELGALNRHKQSCASKTSPLETHSQASNKEQVCPMHILTSLISFMNCVDL